MEEIRQWLLGVLSCTLFTGAVGLLCPEGNARRLVRFTGGLLLLLAMLRPPPALAPPDAAWSADAYRAAVAAREEALARERENALADGIASALAAYIEDKAESLGADVTAEVSLRTEGGVPVPERVTLRGAYNGALAALIASELGVTEEKQEWIGS